MTTLVGSCHCGNLRLSFETGFTPENLPLRACQCCFCRAHGAVTAADPNGRVRISASDPAQVLRYRFGLGITDFLVCAHCGVYAAAIMELDGSLYASINTNVLTVRAQLQMPPQPVDYQDESESARRARRRQHWTPARFDVSPA
jgi:hypothetical protein